MGLRAVRDPHPGAGREAHAIDKGIPTAGLLAEVLVAKYADHPSLLCQETIFARAGLASFRSTLAQWVGTCGVRLQPLVDALHQGVTLQRQKLLDSSATARALD